MVSLPGRYALRVLVVSAIFVSVLGVSAIWSLLGLVRFIVSRCLRIHAGIWLRAWRLFLVEILVPWLRRLVVL